MDICSILTKDLFFFVVVVLFLSWCLFAHDKHDPFLLVPVSVSAPVLISCSTGAQSLGSESSPIILGIVQPARMEVTHFLCKGRGSILRCVGSMVSVTTTQFCCGRTKTTVDST